MAIKKDIVLIYFEDKPLSFARIEEILPDIKADWYHVKLLILQIPVQVVTWILKNAYINGNEFTMGGKKMRLEKIDCPTDKPLDRDEEKPVKSQKTNPAKVISFSDLKKE